MAMQVFGRTYDEFGNPSWNVVTTDANGMNGEVYLTAFIQALKLNLGESPFYANYGIPAEQSVLTQIMPDINVAFMQRQYAGYFASLTAKRIASNPPTYQITAQTLAGTILTAVVPT